MKGLLLLLVLGAGNGFLYADTLDLVFRFYSANGKLNSSQLEVQVKDGNATKHYAPDEGGWQHWKIISTSQPYVLTLHSRTDTVKLDIDVLEKYRKSHLRTLVINRLQAEENKQVLKVNELTCRWTGTIAYPIEYRFVNPLDGQKGKLESISCRRKNDSLNVELHFISDSVLLYTCGKADALFIKYYLGSEKNLYRSPAPFECHTFSNEEQKKLYAILTDPAKALTVQYAGDKFLLLDDAGCYWEFRFQ